MAYYMQLGILTDEGRRAFKDNPDWILELNKRMELMGVKGLTQYALLGQYDFVNIIEAPGDEVAAKVAIKLSATGTVHPLTIAAIPLDKLMETLKKDSQESW